MSVLSNALLCRPACCDLLQHSRIQEVSALLSYPQSKAPAGQTLNLLACQTVWARENIFA